MSDTLELTQSFTESEQGRWSKERIWEWRRTLPPFVFGCNYTPATAANQREMWGKNTFDPITIDKELKIASKLGINAARVFLHDRLWEPDQRESFVKNVNTFLEICKKHYIKVMLVPFDSVWNPDPDKPMLAGLKGVHNPAWEQSPGAAVLKDEAQWPRVLAYAHGIGKAFGHNETVFAIDVLNEPCNKNSGVPDYFAQEPEDKVGTMIKFLPKAFAAIRSANPRQPLTCGVWIGDWTRPLEALQLELSDFSSYHDYSAPMEAYKRAIFIKKTERPAFMTECLARSRGNRLEDIIRLSAIHGVSPFIWGLFPGKTGTIYDWETHKEPGPEDIRLLQPYQVMHELVDPTGKLLFPEEGKYLRVIRDLNAGKKPPSMNEWLAGRTSDPYDKPHTTPWFFTGEKKSSLA